MTKYYTPNTDWLSFTDYEWQDLNTWYNPTGLFAPGSSFVFDTEAVDAGKLGWWLPTTNVATVNTTSGNAYEISYLISDNNQDFTETAPGPLYAQYVKTRVSVTLKSGLEGFDQISTSLSNATVSRRFDGLVLDELQAADTATQAVATGLGITTGRTLSLADSFSKITAVSMETAITETRTLSLVVVDNTPANFTFGVRDLDTWGLVSVDDAEINLTVSGLPLIIYDRSTPSVTPKT